MSRRDRYPQFDSMRELSPNTSSICQASGCQAQATKVVFMQFSYMRGEDECVRCCDEHAKLALPEPTKFVALFPHEAWK